MVQFQNRPSLNCTLYIPGKKSPREQKCVFVTLVVGGQVVIIQHTYPFNTKSVNRRKPSSCTSDQDLRLGFGGRRQKQVLVHIRRAIAQKKHNRFEPSQLNSPWPRLPIQVDFKKILAKSTFLKSKNSQLFWLNQSIRPFCVSC